GGRARCIFRMTLLKRRCSRSACSTEPVRLPSFDSSLRSQPAQNALPAPRRITTLVSRSSPRSPTTPPTSPLPLPLTPSPPSAPRLARLWSASACGGGFPLRVGRRASRTRAAAAGSFRSGAALHGDPVLLELADDRRLGEPRAPRHLVGRSAGPRKVAEHLA